jgi:hypothetical protein
MVKNYFPIKFEFIDITNLTIHAGTSVEILIPNGLFIDLENDDIIYSVSLVDDSALP